ncbi:hypothetical protein GO621_12990 [Mucilaginibacter sp. HMF7410]|uniref:Peptidase C51 domain-containing protein n=1 Tax=Mucilaginibacter arboris TaxID=2682090 RepID=A0A7K1SYV4_9SPHI|nr:hypothetical protein [Mucilaginibacter arboris]
MQVCEACFNANSNNCSGFAKAVAAAFKVILTGQADDIVNQIQSPVWTQLTGGIEAKDKADHGFLVIAGLKGNEHIPAQSHGHVAVVVSGPLDAVHHQYPMGYWGQLGGVGQKDQPLTHSWNQESRDKVIYACVKV